jgi:hypothetical protein
MVDVGGELDVRRRRDPAVAPVDDDQRAFGIARDAVEDPLGARRRRGRLNGIVACSLPWSLLVDLDLVAATGASACSLPLSASGSPPTLDSSPPAAPVIAAPAAGVSSPAGDPGTKTCWEMNQATNASNATLGNKIPRVSSQRGIAGDGGTGAELCDGTPSDGTLPAAIPEGGAAAIGACG